MVFQHVKIAVENFSTLPFSILDCLPLKLYPEELDPNFSYFQWSTRTKMQLLYQSFLKEGNGDQKYLRCPDLQENNFDLLCSSIALDKVNLECSETVKDKSTKNDSGFITYSRIY